jgi:molecular chaperone GrpE (heat shock protein)
MARKPTSHPGATSLAEPEDELMIFEDADEFMSGRSSAPIEEVHTKVKAANEELLHLKQRQEEIEREKQVLEMISQKQSRLAAGKRDLLDKMNRAVVSIERELYSTQKLIEELSCTHDSFARHLEVLRSLHPEKWQREEVDEQLDRALAAVDDAEGDYVKSMRRLSSSRADVPVDGAQAAVAAPSPGAVAEDESMSELLRRGFGLSLPLVGGLLVLLLVARLLF